MKTKLYRFINLFIALAVLAGLSASPRTAAAQVTALTFTPAADSYVLETEPAVNFGANLSLRVDASPMTRSYLRFAVSGLNGATVQSAVLRIYANSGSSAGVAVYRLADTTWSEAGLTYANASLPGALINRSAGFAAGAWVEVDVRSFVTADGVYNLALDTSSTTNTNLAAREDAAHAPQLIVTPAAVPTPTTPPTSAPTATATSLPPTATATAVPPTATPTMTTAPTATPVTPTATSLPVQPSVVTFNAAADTYVIETSPSANYGASTTLRADSSPITRSYLRFAVSGLGGKAVQSAVLRLYANSANGSGLTAHAVSNTTWTETGVTYSNSPALGSAIATSQPFSGAAWVEINVTSYVRGEGAINLGVYTASTTNTSLASRETAGKAPQLVLTLGSATGPTPTATTGPTATVAPTATQPPSTGSNIMLTVGDICKYNLGGTSYIARCKQTGDLVRSFLAANPGAIVQGLGDQVANDGGSASYDAEFTNLYEPNWGSFKNVTRPLIGNHETYPPSGLKPYFNYFGASAGPQPGGYYSYNVGANWKIIVLNSECTLAGGCNVGSAQYNWLKNELAANTRKCVLAAWHAPRFTSGRHSDDTNSAPWWDLLYQYKADIVLNSHNHQYERFHKINPQQQLAADGIREFVVGTGGSPSDAYSYASKPLDAGEAIRSQVETLGVLQLTLNDASYSWKFLPVPGYTFTDSGSEACN